MTWRRQSNYHGSRTYGVDERPGSRLRLDLAVLGGWVKQQLEKLMRSGAPRSEDVRTLVHARERNFSLLGADNQRAVTTSIWPSPKRHQRAGGWRGDLDSRASDA
jgi:hypothetical protein